MTLVRAQGQTSEGDRLSSLLFNMEIIRDRKLNRPGDIINKEDQARGMKEI